MPNYKVSCYGYQQSGKTVLINGMMGQPFVHYYQPSRGAAFLTLNYQLLGQDANTPEAQRDKLQFWEIAGDSNYFSLLPMYMSGASALLLVVDLQRWGTIDPKDETFVNEKNNLIECIHTFRKRAIPNSPIYLIGTKQDEAITDVNNGKSTTLDVAIQRLVTLANSEIKYEENNQAITAQIPSQNILITSAKQINSNVSSTFDDVTPVLIEPIALLKKVYEDVKSIALEGAKKRSLFNVSHLNKGLGWLVGPFVGAFFGFLCRNPGVCLLAAFRAQDWQEWSVANLLRAYIFAPLINPIAATLYGAKDGAIYGGTHGASELINLPREMAKGIETRTIVAGSILSLFIGAVAIIAVYSLLPLALPLLLGIAGASALIGAVSYEGYNFYQTNHELAKIEGRLAAQQMATRPLLVAATLPLSTAVAAANTHSSRLSTNNLTKANYYHSVRSWLQAPPAPPEDSNVTQASYTAS